ncbi:Interferon-inducible double stranded RNA-dependent protein kinase activator A -like protein, partial [Caligus rogercresseyi]
QSCRDYGDYDDGIPGNPVGELQELCMNRRMQPPTYEPHERSFVLVCIVGSKYRESGSGKSKKLAKRQAAYKMLSKLKTIPASTTKARTALDEDELALGIAHGTPRYGKSANRTISSPPRSAPSWAQSSPLSRASQISQEQDFSVTYVDIEEVALNGESHCLIQLSTDPVAVCYGVGTSAKEAKLNAAFHACEYLRIITK